MNEMQREAWCGRRRRRRREGGDRERARARDQSVTIKIMNFGHSIKLASFIRINMHHEIVMICLEKKTEKKFGNTDKKYARIHLVW